MITKVKVFHHVLPCEVKAALLGHVNNVSFGADPVPGAVHVVGVDVVFVQHSLQSGAFGRSQPDAQRRENVSHNLKLELHSLV